MTYSDYKNLKNKIIALQGDIDRIQSRIMEEAARLSDVYEELEKCFNYIVSCVEVEPDDERQGYSYPQKEG